MGALSFRSFLENAYCRTKWCSFYSNDNELYYSHITQTDGRPTDFEQNFGNRATSADCRPMSAPILAEFLVGRRLFCRSTQVKSFVDRSADFQGFCHRWSVGRWSPDDRPTVGRRFEEIYIMISAEGRPIIGRQSADDRQTVGRWGFIKESSAARHRYRPSFGRWSPDCRTMIKCDLCNIFYNACMHFMYAIKSCINAILGFISLDLVYKYHLAFLLFLDF